MLNPLTAAAVTAVKTAEEYEAELAALRAQVKPRTSDLTFRVSTKGAVSVYGLGRFPVTLYAEQWERLAPRISDLLVFIEMHESQVNRKE